MKKITDWENTKVGTAIYLKEDTDFMGLNGPFRLPAGKYYIIGFWANAMGIASLPPAEYNKLKIPTERDGFAEHFISPVCLTQFHRK